MGSASDVSRGEFGVEVAVYGLAQVQKALRSLASVDGQAGEVSKVLDREIRSALNVTRDAARRRIPTQPPMSGWIKDKSDAGYRNWWRVQTGSSRRTSRGGAGWPVWDAGRARSGIKVAKGNSRNHKGLATMSVAWRLESSDAAGTIYDKAGTKTEGTGSGVQFIKNLVAQSGVQVGHQRVLWPAWMSTRREAMDRINRAIDQMEASVNALISSMDRAA